MAATAALLSVAQHGQISPPRAGFYAACLLRAEEAHRVPWPRIAAVVQHESQWRAELVSSTNDFGLGQHHCPSFFCARHPLPVQRAALLEPCTNLLVTAAELDHKRRYCRRIECRDYVALYNPGNPTYAAGIARWEARFRAGARAVRWPRVASISP
jgi:hypothetical protein